MKQINLLPKAEQDEFKLHLFSKRLLKFWVVLVGSILVFWVLAWLTQLYLGHSISETADQISQNKSLLESADYKNLESKILLLNRNIKEIENLRDQHYYWSQALIQLSDLMPDDVQLNSFTLERATGKIEIAGQAKTRESVIALWANVIKSDYFKNINFPLTNLEKAQLSSFTYTFYVNKSKFQTP